MVAVTACTSVPPDAPALAARCMDGRQTELKAGGYSGPMICEGERASFRRVGTAHGAGRDYLVYDYRYQFSFEGGTVLYRGQRVLVLDASGRYLGQYALTPPPLLDVAIRGSAIAISVSGADKGSIDLRDGPPPVVTLNAERLKFFE